MRKDDLERIEELSPVSGLVASIADQDNPQIPSRLWGKGIGQIGILVPDLETALRAYDPVPNVAPWRIYTFDPNTVPRLEFRGRPGSFRIRLALGGTSPQLELIQVINGPSIYDEWIEQRGYGLHHLGFFVETLDLVVSQMAASGFPAIQQGWGYGLDGDGGFAYFDVAPAASVILEAIERPARMRPSESRWPAPD